ncbi:MAG: class IV adenylate cyclase [Theionarchaea archaeon]|nr:class IV adenylate cyclase [Theionarchaea archaeon]
MALEIEVKAYVEDILQLERTLCEMGAYHEATLYQVDSYFNHPSHNFAETDEALRIRTSNNNALLTYKGPKIDSCTITREELEIHIDDPDTSQLLLERLGFQFIARVKKKREVHTYENFHIYLDKVEGLGIFIEVEIQEKDLERGRSKIIRFLKELHLHRLERRSYLELLLEKNGM